MRPRTFDIDLTRINQIHSSTSRAPSSSMRCSSSSAWDSRCKYSYHIRRWSTISTSLVWERTPRSFRGVGASVATCEISSTIECSPGADRKLIMFVVLSRLQTPLPALFPPHVLSLSSIYFLSLLPSSPLPPLPPPPPPRDIAE